MENPWTKNSTRRPARNQRKTLFNNNLRSKRYSKPSTDCADETGNEQAFKFYNINYLTIKKKTGRQFVSVMDNHRPEYAAMPPVSGLKNLKGKKMKEKLLLILLLLSVQLLSKEGGDSISFQQQLKPAVERYAENLQHENAGVASSTMVLLAKIRVKFPDTDLREVETRLRQRAISEGPAGLRLKAFLMLNFLQNPDEFPEIKDSLTNDPELFFHELFQSIYDTSISQLRDRSIHISD